MAIQPTNIYLVHLRDRPTWQFFSRLFEKQLRLETLDPKELGTQWQNVHLSSELEVTSKEAGMRDLKTVIDEHLKTGFFSQFEDIRGTVDIKELTLAPEEIHAQINTARAILDYEGLDLRRKILLKKRKKPKNIETTEEEFQNISTQLTALATYLQNQGYDPKNDVLQRDTLKQMLLAYTQLELEHRIVKECANIFKLSKNRPNQFVFLAVSTDSSEEFLQFLEQEKIESQPVDWVEDIVTWKTKTKSLGAFQGIAQSIGTLGRHEFDPTLLIGFFFSLFFAMSINDALYGLVIATITGYFIYARNLKNELKNIFTLFFYSGLMSIFVGALTNSWGGDLFQQTLPPLSRALGVFQILEPLDPSSNLLVNNYLRQVGGVSPIVAMLAFAVALGLVHIFIAYALNVINSVLANKTQAALFEASWLVFLGALLVTLYFIIASPAALLIPVAVLGVSALGLFVFNSGKSPIMKFAGGLIKMYDLIGFMADMLSYTRLIAVGLTGSIIAIVINLLAGIVTDSFGPVLGFVLGLSVLLVGHTFNLVVSLFGAYINPLRLHYVEFMPKFYEGKSRSLQPLNQQLTYAKLKA